jgi:hypothetical protein
VSQGGTTVSGGTGSVTINAQSAQVQNGLGFTPIATGNLLVGGAAGQNVVNAAGANGDTIFGGGDADVLNGPTAYGASGVIFGGPARRRCRGWPAAPLC